MRKYIMIAVMIFGVIIMIGCSKNEYSKVYIGDSIIRANEIYGESYIDLNTVNVFVNDKKYIVTISDDEQNIKSIAIYDINNNLLYADGIKPINSEGVEQFYGKTMNEVEKKLGKIHCDTGSGFYIPTYVTEDALIVTMYTENNLVVNISSVDVITKYNDKIID